jgi:hypothetical protein
LLLPSAQPCSRGLSLHTIRTHGKVGSNTPSETSRTLLPRYQHTHQACALSLHSIERYDSHICPDRAFHSPMRVRRGSFRQRNRCGAWIARGLNECLFEYGARAIWAVGRRCQNVIRHARSGARHAIEDVIEGNFSSVIARFARFDQLLGFAHSCTVDKNNDLLF